MGRNPVVGRQGPKYHQAKIPTEAFMPGMESPTMIAPLLMRVASEGVTNVNGFPEAMPNDP